MDSRQAELLMGFLLASAWCYEGPGVQPYWTDNTAKKTHSITLPRPQNSKAANLAGSFSVY